MRNQRVSLNDKNLLAGLTPTFAGFTQNPGTNAQIVSELDRSLTTNGIVPATSNSTITYDLGASKRIIAAIVTSVATNADIGIAGSDDNITFFTNASSLPASAPFVSNSSTILKCRYVQFLFSNNAAGAWTFTSLNMKVYQVGGI